MNDGYRRVIVWFRKRGEATELSHLELMRVMEEAFQRSGLPVRWTQGATPKVKMSFPTALPQGMTSLVETVEIQVLTGVTCREICERFAAELPEGIEPFDVDAKYSGEKFRVTEIGYDVAPGSAAGFPRAELAALLGRDEIPAERRGRAVDLKKYLGKADLEDGGGRFWIRWTDRGTARPEDYLKAIELDPAEFRVRKTGMTFETSFGETIRRDGTQDTGQ